MGYLLVGTAFAAITVALFFAFFIGFNTAPVEEAKAATTNVTIPTGSFIVRMGQSPQTVDNALKPYGLVYDMIVNYNVPVYWSIEPSKAKDGVDFSYLGLDYKGGPFIIDDMYITPAVYNRLIWWTGQGVNGIFTISDVTVPVYTTLEYFPNILIDDLSGNEAIITNYFDNAAIPSIAYTIGNPNDANMCFDVWVNPHGDPEWSTHGNLYNFVTNHRGFIWSQCHAVSMMEGTVNPSPPNEQLNYLSIDGLQCYHNRNADQCGPTITELHDKKPTGPFTHQYPADPVMQFMGNADVPLHSNGSESWFSPQTTGGWRTSTKRLITTADSLPPHEGILMAYGPAFGDTSNGWVMYSAGHDHTGGGTTEEQIAAQRSFLNFILLCGKERTPLAVTDIDTEITGWDWYNFSVTPSGGYSPYTYSWSSSIGGTFYNPDSSHTGYLSPYVTSPTTGIIQCIVTDSCSRVMAFSQVVTVSPSPLPVTLTEFTATPMGMDKVMVSWKTASELNNRYFTVERSTNLQDYTVVGNVPTLGNGTIPHNYTLNDYKPHPGKSYYRLSQTDINGAVEYFDPVMVNRSVAVTPQKLTVGPNPFRDQFNLTINYELGNQLSVRLYDLNGRMIKEQQVMPNGAATAIRFTSLEDLPNGNYILKVEDGLEFSEVTRLIKR